MTAFRISDRSGTFPSSPSSSQRGDIRTYFGWRVVGAAFMIAVFAWGVGFYGPPVYLYATHQARGWSIGLISAAVTTHFLVGAAVVANLPRLHGRLGLGRTSKLGALSLALGVVCWALASHPWQLFAATLLSGFGWGTTSGAAINAMISPWFRARRPMALSLAYNGASVGGVVLSPLWAVAIAGLGFAWAALLVGLAMVAAVWALCDRYVARTPGATETAQESDLDAGSAARPTLAGTTHGWRWGDRRLVTLAAAMAIGLFAQIGLIAHLFSLLLPTVGARVASLAVGLATLCAIGGRLVVGRFVPRGAHRRTAGATAYLVQAAGCGAFLLAGGTSVPLLLCGVVLFGSGIGNATSLPPLIAQAEFDDDVVRHVVAVITAVSQATYAVAPAAFGLLRDSVPPGRGPAAVFAAAGVIQLVAAGCYVAGRLRG